MLVDETLRAWQGLGEPTFGAGITEEGSQVFRRSLYFVHDLEAGSVIGPDDVRAIRPGYGLPPHWKEHVIGRKVARTVARGTPVTWGAL
jgi:N-acetylneuraminate synthase